MQRGSVPDGLSGRAHLNFAIFWGRWNEPPTTPEGGSPHGRLYLPTETEPAVVVVTAPWMEVGPDATDIRHPGARPIPVALEEHRDALGHQIEFVA